MRAMFTSSKGSILGFTLMVTGPGMLATLAPGCDDPPLECGIFVVDETGERCVCPTGTTEGDGGHCYLPDGAVYRGFQDAAAAENDAGVDVGCADSTTEPCSIPSAVGECAAGTRTCVDGAWTECEGGAAPAAELCNGRDDDCDSVIDGPTAAVACGAADRALAVGCSAGACLITECSAGHGDCDGDFANGCEAPFGTVDHCASCGDTCGWACEAGACNDAVDVAVGFNNTFAIRQRGDVTSWGSNERGTIGDGSRVTRLSPVRVGGLPAPAIEIASTIYASCAVLSTGAVWCWGHDFEDSTLVHTSPVEMSRLPGTAVDIAAGDNHACVVLSTGSVLCWGQNNAGQLGDGTMTPRIAPVAPMGITNARAVMAGPTHTCARLADGSVRCWGANHAGQLGDGTTVARTTPVAVTSLVDVIELAGGRAHVCATTSSGSVHCWGDNAEGQLGDGTNFPRRTPTTVAALAGDVTSIGAGESHTCAVLATGAAQCWGRNAGGQLGDGTTSARTTPTMVVDLPSPVLRISGGAGSTCAVAGGAAWCWGTGALGDGVLSREPRPPVLVHAP
jgi:alpha-tubulin suppressor-like RCC1 family protein